MATLTTVLTCRFCGASPAINAIVRGHRGLLIFMQFRKLPGPYCRSCGIAMVREMSARSLWQGWTSFFSFLINPLTLLWNLVVRIRLQRLPAVQVPGAVRAMDEGKPLYRRLRMLGLIIPVAVVGWLLYDKFVVGHYDVSVAGVGNCVAVSGNSENLTEAVDCISPDAAYRVVGRSSGTADPAGCEAYPSATKTFTDKRRSTPYVMCLEPLKAQ